jgi:uncharacterized protein (DUF697 family)
MPSWLDVGNIWQIMREVDLRPIRAQAERVTQIAVVGGDLTARTALVEALCKNRSRSSFAGDPGLAALCPAALSLSEARRGLEADLVVLLLGSLPEDQASEGELFEEWRNSGKAVVVIYRALEPSHGLHNFRGPGVRVIGGSTADLGFMERQFVPTVLSLMPENILSLARHYPLFRIPVAQQLISETSTANASYSLGTGLAEIVPLLDLPFNLADMIILTKAQAVMAYKLGLALGLSGKWQDHMAAFGGTIGSGFLWRQVARQLVGLIPVWGILPKVAVAYAGTYVLGQAILHWYITGRQATPEMMRQMYRDAFNQGKALARSLVERSPRGKRRTLAARSTKVCSNCRTVNPGEFNYCGSCGSPLK